MTVLRLRQGNTPGHKSRQPQHLWLERTQIRFFDELRDVTPRLSSDDRQRLEFSIQHDGIRDSVIVCKDPHDREHFVVVDGYERCEIADKYDISPVRVECRHYDSLADTQLARIDTRLTRANLTKAQIADLLLQRVNIEQKLAHQREADAGKQRSQAAQRNADGTFCADPGVREFADPWLGKRRGTVARLTQQSTISENTLQRMKVIKRHPEVYDRVIRGEISINAGYHLVQQTNPTHVEKAQLIRLDRREDKTLRTLKTILEERHNILAGLSQKAALNLTKSKSFGDRIAQLRVLINVIQQHIAYLEAPQPTKSKPNKIGTLHLVKATSH